ncbi:MAG: hypothetical protein WAU00_03580 [Caldilinea sp.]
MASTAAIGGTGADVAPPTGSNNTSLQIAARLAGVMKGTPALLRFFHFFRWKLVDYYSRILAEMVLYFGQIPAKF